MTRDARARYEESRRLHGEGQHDRALTALREALALDPELPNGKNFEGWILYKRPDRNAEMLARAIECFAEAAGADPSNHTPVTNLADALLAAGRDDEAVLRMEAAARNSSAGADNWLGWYFSRRKGDLARALVHLDKATRMGGWFGPAHLNRGFVLERLGRADDAYDAYRDALLSADAHDRSWAYLGRGTIELSRGWTRHALGSARRALFCEEQGKHGHVDEARTLEHAAIDALDAAGAYWPHAEEERRWWEAEVKARREGLGVVEGAAVPSFDKLVNAVSTAIRATRSLPGPEGAPKTADAIDALAESRATLEAMLHCAEARALLPEYAGRSFAVHDDRRAVVTAARAWAHVHLWMWEDALARELPSTPGPFERAEALCREGRYREAAIAFEEVVAKDASLLVDCMGICERASDAARVTGDLDAAIALLVLAHRGHQVWASWSTSGGEGMSRMLDVERLERAVRALRNASTDRER